MASPEVKPCPADVWTLVATEVHTGVVHIDDTSPNMYLQTYRDTGEAAPVDLTGALPFDPLFQISMNVAIDVYVRAVKNAGSVRVDL